MARYRVDCAYNGSKYYGFQKQADKPTVQGLIERLLGELLDCSLKIYPAGRTDRGVHAVCQPFHFSLAESHLRKLTTGPDDWLKIFNSYTRNRAVKLLRIVPVSRQFDARHSALGRFYGYRFIQMNRSLSRLFSEPCGWVNRQFNVNRAARAVEFLDGGVPTRIFSGSGGSTFQAENWPLKLQLLTYPGQCWLVVGARSFRYKMVRSVARAVREVAVGNCSFEQLVELVGQSKHSLKPAPPQGCYLLRVFYHSTDLTLNFMQAKQQVDRLNQAKYF